MIYVPLTLTKCEVHAVNYGPILFCLDLYQVKHTGHVSEQKNEVLKTYSIDQGSNFNNLLIFFRALVKEGNFTSNKSFDLVSHTVKYGPLM